MPVETHTLTVPGQMLAGGARTGTVRIEAVAADPDTEKLVVLREVRASGEEIFYSGDEKRLGGGDLTLELPATDAAELEQAFAYRITLELDHLGAGDFPAYTLALTEDRNLDDVDADDLAPTVAPNGLAERVAQLEDDVEELQQSGPGAPADAYADLGTWADDSAVTAAGTYAVTLAGDVVIDLPELDNGAAVLLWLYPTGGTRTATVAGYSLTVSAKTLASFQRVREAWELVAGPTGSTAPTPVAADFPLMFTDADGTVSDSVLIPTTPNVTYRRAGEDLDPGVLLGSSVDTYPIVSIVAVAAEGYVIDGASTWSHTFTTTSAPTEVTPAAVTFDDQAGTSSDTYTVPSTTGVVYKVGGVTKAAGTYPGSGTVTVVASATSGYVLASGATTTWSHPFDTAGGGGGGAPVVALHDTFTGADATILDGRVPDVGPAAVRGYAWAGNHGEGSSYPDLVISGNKVVRGTISGSGSTHYWPFSNQALSTLTASFDYAWQQTEPNQGASIDLRVNWSGSDSFQVQVYRDNNGQPAGMRLGEHTTGTVTGSIPASGTLTCVVTGTSLVISINGTQVATATLDQAITQLKSYSIVETVNGSDSGYARFSVDNPHLEYTA